MNDAILIPKGKKTRGRSKWKEMDIKIQLQRLPIVDQMALNSDAPVDESYTTVLIVNGSRNASLKKLAKILPQENPQIDQHNQEISSTNDDLNYNSSFDPNYIIKVEPCVTPVRPTSPLLSTPCSSSKKFKSSTGLPANDNIVTSSQIVQTQSRPLNTCTNGNVLETFREPTQIISTSHAKPSSAANVFVDCLSNQTAAKVQNKVVPVSVVKPQQSDTISIPQINFQTEINLVDDDDDICIIGEVIDVESYQPKQQYQEAVVTPDGFIISENCQILGCIPRQKFLEMRRKLDQSNNLISSNSFEPLNGNPTCKMNVILSNPKIAYKSTLTERVSSDVKNDKLELKTKCSLSICENRSWDNYNELEEESVDDPLQENTLSHLKAEPSNPAVPPMTCVATLVNVTSTISTPTSKVTVSNANTLTKEVYCMKYACHQNLEETPIDPSNSLQEDHSKNIGCNFVISDVKSLNESKLIKTQEFVSPPEEKVLAQPEPVTQSELMKHLKKSRSMFKLSLKDILKLNSKFHKDLINS